jgi:hypothetical protein
MPRPFSRLRVLHKDHALQAAVASIHRLRKIHRLRARSRRHAHSLGRAAPNVATVWRGCRFIAMQCNIVKPLKACELIKIKLYKTTTYK